MTGRSPQYIWAITAQRSDAHAEVEIATAWSVQAVVEIVSALLGYERIQPWRITITARPKIEED